MPFYPSVMQLAQISNVYINASTVGFPSRNVTPVGNSVAAANSYKTLLSVSEGISTQRGESWQIQLRDSFLSADQQVQRVLKEIGRPTTFIGYVLRNTMHEGGSCCNGQCTCCKCEYRWLETTGMIRDVAVSSRDNYDTYNLEISVEFDDYWYGLNRYRWSFGQPSSQNLYTADYTGFTYDELMGRVPSCKTNISKECLQFIRRNFADYDFMLDTYYMNGLLETEKSGNVISGFSNGVKRIYVDETVWSAPPKSIYIYTFDGTFAQAGTSTITIDQTVGIYLRQLIYTVDWDEVAQLYTDNGETFATSDKLLVGDIDGSCRVVDSNNVLKFYANSALTRGGGAWWGQLNSGVNELLIENPVGVTVSAINHFRRF